MTGTLYLSQILGKPLIDAGGAIVGTVSDLAISTAEVFPRVVAVSFKSADKTPRMLSWQDTVSKISDEGIHLNKSALDLEYNYLQEDELLLARDLLHKQIVDVAGKKVVRVSDLKLSSAGDKAALRLLGAECGMRGRLQYMPSFWASITGTFMRAFGRTPHEHLIAWNYIDLPSRDMSTLELSVSHQRLHKLHPADVADIIEQLDPAARAAVFAHLDKDHAAETISEMEDEYQADVIEDLSEDHASDLLSKMNPDDAADVIADLDYDKAERLLRLMGFEDAEQIRGLLGYPKDTAGGIMTPEVAVATEKMTVAETIEYLRRFAKDASDLHYVYLVADADKDGQPVADSKLVGVVTLYELLIQDDKTALGEFAHREVLSVLPDADQEDVADMIAKYNLLALPVVDEGGCLLGTVTVDDALDVMEEEAEEDLARAIGRSEGAAQAAEKDAAGAGGRGGGDGFMLVLRRIGRGLRWCLPQSISWVGMWLGMIVVVNVGAGHVIRAFNDPALSGAGGSEAAYATLNVLYSTLMVLQMMLIVLPLVFMTIRYVVLRAIEQLTDTEASERPGQGKLYLAGAGIALGEALIVFILALLVMVLNVLSNFQASFQPSLMEFFETLFVVVQQYALIFLLPLFVAFQATSAFAVWRVTRTVAADDADIAIKPARTAAGVMLVFLLLMFIASGAASYGYYQYQIAQEPAMEYEDDSFDYMGEGDGAGAAEGEEINLEDLIVDDAGDEGAYAEGSVDQELMVDENGNLIDAPTP